MRWSPNLGIESDMWTGRERAMLAKTTFRNVLSLGDLSATGKTPPQKGRPPPGGEEAEVVVYQPRGVGLMHTRRRPSDAHYTHAGAGWRKYRFANKSATTRKDYSHRHLS